MKIDFDNILEHVVVIDNFQLSWRFTDTKYNKLPSQHLEQLKPFDKEASTFLSNYIENSNLHDDIPFKKGFFQTIDKAKILDDNKREVKKWLYQRGLSFDRNVYLCWDKGNAMTVPWKIFIKYFDSFYYSASDDLTVFDESLNWAMLFYHEDEIYFGTNQKFRPSKDFADIEFIW